MTEISNSLQIILQYVLLIDNIHISLTDLFASNDINMFHIVCVCVSVWITHVRTFKFSDYLVTFIQNMRIRTKLFNAKV